MPKFFPNSFLYNPIFKMAWILFAVSFLLANQIFGHIEYKIIGLDNIHQKIAIDNAFNQLRFAQNPFEADEQAAQLQTVLNQSSQQNINGLMAIAAQKEERGENQQALLIYEQIIKIDSKFFPAMIAAGAIEFELGNHQKALGLLKTAIAQEPRNYVAYEGMGAIYERNEDWKNAKKAYESALFHNPYSNVATRGLNKIDQNMDGLRL